MLHKTISVSEQVADISDKAKLFYTWSISHADDFGMIWSSPRKLKSLVVPYWDATLRDVTDMVGEIVRAKLWECCELGDQEWYYFPKWFEYQKLRRDIKPEIYAYPSAKWEDYKNIKIVSCKLPERHVTDTDESVAQDKISKDKISKDKISSSTAVAVSDHPPEIDKSTEEYLNGLNDVGYVMELFRRAFGSCPKPVKGEKNQDLNALAAARLVKKLTRQGLRTRLELIFNCQKVDQYCKICTNPLDFEKNYIWYQTYLEQKKTKMSGGILK